MTGESDFKRLISIETELISLLDASTAVLHKFAAARPSTDDSLMRLIIISRNLAEALRVTRQMASVIANEDE